MRIDVLGPIEVTDEGQVIRLSGQRQRALLAALVLDLGKVVPVSRLIDTLWDTCPPPSAVPKIHVHVSRLRQAFGPDATRILVTSSPGYMLCGVEVDLAEFDVIVSRARAAHLGGDSLAASDLFAAALDMWRGHPFADVASAPIQSAAEGIEERRLLMIEAKAEADLLLGRSDVVAAQLRGALAEHPLRERLRALLILALYRLGCRADALGLYLAGRQATINELGLEPSVELRRLHQSILTDDPALRHADWTGGQPSGIHPMYEHI
jgi:DNA-binding SARP family transcriptional activator